MKKSIIIKHHYTGNGYPTVTLYKEGKGIKNYCHRLVAQAFLDNPHGKRTVNHKNGVRTDNRLENLEWMSYSENIRHAIDTGLNVPRKGSQFTNTRFSEPDVFLLKKMMKAGISIQKLSPIYGVKDYVLANIRAGRRWKHIIA